jgi:hypothetical protein
MRAAAAAIADDLPVFARCRRWLPTLKVKKGTEVLVSGFMVGAHTPVVEPGRTSSAR